MKQIEMHTDGACLGNPGPAAWCAILRYNGHERVVTGYTSETSTNNKAELMAVIDGLTAIKEPCEVTVISDSQYVVKGVNEWGMIGKAVTGSCKNAEEWLMLADAMKGHRTTFKWVRGHNGDRGNERANAIAEGLLRKVETI